MGTRKSSRPSRKAKSERPMILIGVEIPKPTPQQARWLRRIFRVSTIAVLGVEKGFGYTNQRKTMKRPVGER
jgi:hypothetical protein